MKAQDFIRMCCLLGYANKKQAEAYVQLSGKTKFVEDDFISVYQKIQDSKSFQARDNSLRNYKGVKSTKHLNYDRGLGRDRD